MAKEKGDEEVLLRSQNLVKLMKVLGQSLCESFQFDEQSSMCVATEVSFSPSDIQSALIFVCTAMLEAASLDTLEVWFLDGSQKCFGIFFLKLFFQKLLNADRLGSLGNLKSSFVYVLVRSSPHLAGLRFFLSFTFQAAN